MQRAFLAAMMLSPALCMPLAAQQLISVHAGLVTFAPAPVEVGDKTVPVDPGSGIQLAVGETLASPRGPVEVLLRPLAILRGAAGSRLRMLDRTLDAPMVILDQGVFVLEVIDSVEGDIRIRAGNTLTRIRKQGLYRFQLSNQLLLVYEGEARMESPTPNGQMASQKVKKGRMANLVTRPELKLQTAKFDRSVTDEFHQWNVVRSARTYEESLMAVAPEGKRRTKGHWMITLGGDLFSSLYQTGVSSPIAAKLRSQQVAAEEYTRAEMERLRERLAQQEEVQWRQRQRELNSTPPGNVQLPPATQTAPQQSQAQNGNASSL